MTNGSEVEWNEGLERGFDGGKGGRTCQSGRRSAGDCVFMCEEHERHFEVVGGVKWDGGWIEGSRRSRSCRKSNLTMPIG